MSACLQFCMSARLHVCSDERSSHNEGQVTAKESKFSLQLRKELPIRQRSIFLQLFSKGCIVCCTYRLGAGRNTQEGCALFLRFPFLS